MRKEVNEMSQEQPKWEPQGPPLPREEEPSYVWKNTQWPEPQIIREWQARQFFRTELGIADPTFEQLRARIAEEDAFNAEFEAERQAFLAGEEPEEDYAKLPGYNKGPFSSTRSPGQWDY